MTGPVAVRTAGDGEVDALLALIHAAYRGDAGRSGWTTEAGLIEGTRTTRELLAAELADPAVTVLVAGAVDGCAAVTLAGDRASFGTFAVRPDRQRGGIGSVLLAAAEDLARARGARAMEMTVISVRDDLLAWYARRGYAPTGETRPFPYGDERYGSPRTDALEFVVLVKALDGSPATGGDATLAPCPP